MKKEYREKYKRELGWDEELVHFAMKVIGSATLFFVLAIGVDAYHFFY